MDVEKIREDFPILKREIRGKRIVYLDNGATSQKPQAVIDAIVEYYKEHNANVMRGVHTLGEEATHAFENSREKVKSFINAGNSKEIIFTSNATEGTNLVLYSWGMKNISSEDRILISVAEHHANLVTWQQLALKKNAKLEYIDVDSDGKLIDPEEKIKGVKPKLFAITHVSNVTGVINDVENLCRSAKDEGAVTLVDGAQSVPHMKVDVRRIGCDFFAFTGHKMLGPTGTGGLYCSERMYGHMDPFNYGGEMIQEVHKFSTEWNSPPHKFEAGTPNICGAIGLGAAVDYLKKTGMDRIRQHEKDITKYAMERMDEIGGMELIGPKRYSEDKAGLIAFKVDGVHPHDIATLLNEDAIMVRSGLHCAQPLHEFLKFDASTRASFYLYNTLEEVDKLIEGIKKAKDMLG